MAEEDRGKVAEKRCTVRDMGINQPDVALIFEGGGMRCAATAGLVVTLLENNLNFPKAYGISAGSSHAINYLSRDVDRARASFVDLVLDPQFGGWKSMLSGKGYFNAAYLYEGIIEELEGSDADMAFAAKTFFENPADLHIEAFDWNSGETVAWTKSDMHSALEIGRFVRASSSMPGFMPPATIDGRTYMDGGIGDSWGILLDAARADGFTKFVVVRTQEHDYRKHPLPAYQRALFRLMFRKHPSVAQRSIERWQPYNAILDELDKLEVQGSAFVYCPDKMPIGNRETSYEKLKAAYDDGYAQAQRELPRLLAWLEEQRRP